MSLMAQARNSNDVQSSVRCTRDSCRGCRTDDGLRVVSMITAERAQITSPSQKIGSTPNVLSTPEMCSVAIPQPTSDNQSEAKKASGLVEKAPSRTAGCNKKS